MPPLSILSIFTSKSLRLFARRVVTVVAGAFMVAVLLLAPAVASASSWYPFQEVPGVGSLNVGGVSEVVSVSCPTSGDCTAGGFYVDASGLDQAMIVQEVNGTWQSAIDLPGTAALSNNGNSFINSISCPTFGDCSVGGWYQSLSGSGDIQMVVASEVNGAWQSAIEVPEATLGDFGGGIVSVACWSSGDCTAGGGYYDSSGGWSAVVDDEVNGVWQEAIQVPGSSVLDIGDIAEVDAVSCSSDGSCVALGSFTDGSNQSQAMVANEVNGVWQPATEIPGSGALNVGGNAWINSVSCTQPGDCSAAGLYEDGSGSTQAMVANEVNGVWQSATELPGSGALNVGGNAWINSVSCTQPGDCSAAGQYRDGSGSTQAMVASEVNGVWQSATELPGSGALNVGGNATLLTLSCASPGNCEAGGQYNDGTDLQSLLASEVNGVWQPSVEAPGTAALNVGGNSETSSISCSTDGYCAAGGYYLDSNSNTQPFVGSNLLVQSTLSISPTSDTVNIGDTLTLTSSGGSGGGLVSFRVDSSGTSGCTISGNVLTASNAGTCTVYASKAGDASYAGAHSSDAIVQFRPNISPPTGLSISSSTYQVNGAVRSTFLAQWYPSPGATSYTCTLLYGYNIPSTFSVHTTAPDCSFMGLLLGSGYGIAVVANEGTSMSLPTTLFASTPTLSTITCRRARHTFTETGIQPSCPIGSAKV